MNTLQYIAEADLTLNVVTIGTAYRLRDVYRYIKFNEIPKNPKSSPSRYIAFIKKIYRKFKDPDTIKKGKTIAIFVKIPSHIELYDENFKLVKIKYRSGTTLLAGVFVGTIDNVIQNPNINDLEPFVQYSGYDTAEEWARDFCAITSLLDYTPCSIYIGAKRRQYKYRMPILLIITYVDVVTYYGGKSVGLDGYNIIR